MTRHRALRRLVALAAGCLACALPAVAHGARAERVVAGVPEPANLAFDARGRLWIASGGHLPKSSNGVWLVRRPRARPVQVIAGRYSALGLTWHRGRLYLAYIVPAASGGHVGQVSVYWGFDGRRFARSRVLVDGLPVGRHRLGSIVAGPGGRLYLGVGSEYDNRASRSRLSGTVISFRRSGGDVRLEATGLRNPYGLAFIPGTSTLLISEHGRDDLGLHHPPEELNALRVSGSPVDFGFPECYGQGGPACRGTRSPLVDLPAHSAPGALAVSARSPSRAVAYLPRFGSSFAANPTGGDIVAIDLRRDGGTWRARSRSFATGLGLQNPLGAAIDRAGRLHVSLWTDQRVLRYRLPRATAPRVRRASPAVSLGRLPATAGGLLAGLVGVRAGAACLALPCAEALPLWRAAARIAKAYR